jgi:hypothetical protein
LCPPLPIGFVHLADENHRGDLIADLKTCLPCLWIMGLDIYRLNKEKASPWQYSHGKRRKTAMFTRQSSTNYIAMENHHL